MSGAADCLTIDHSDSDSRTTVAQYTEATSEPAFQRAHCPSMIVSGYVADMHTGTAIQDANVVLAGPGHTVGSAVLTNADGFFKITAEINYSPADLYIDVKAPRYHSTRRTFVGVERSEDAIIVPMRRSVDVVLAVTNENGLPVANADVFVGPLAMKWGSSDWIPILEKHPASVKGLRTGTDGVARIENLPAEAQLQYQVTKGAEIAWGEIYTGVEDTISYPVVISATGRLCGYAVDHVHQALIGKRLRFQPKVHGIGKDLDANGRWPECQTGSEGEFSLELPVGDWAVSLVEGSHPPSQTIDLTMRRGTTSVTLEFKKLCIEGVVRDVTGRPLDGVMVSGRSQAGDRFSSTTARGGLFRAEFLAALQYLVDARSGLSYGQATANAGYPCGDLVTIVMQHGATINGVIEDDGATANELAVIAIRLGSYSETHAQKVTQSKFSFAGLVPGRYAVGLSPQSDLCAQTQEVNVEPGREAQVSLKVESGTPIRFSNILHEDALVVEIMDILRNSTQAVVLIPGRDGVVVELPRGGYSIAISDASQFPGAGTGRRWCGDIAVADQYQNIVLP